MKKAIVTADLHIDINNRLDDTKNILNQIAKYAIDNKVNYVMVLGDIYERRRPYNSEKAVFEKFVKYLSDHAVEVHILAGNHDMDKDQVSAVEEFKILDLDGIILHENPTIIELLGNKIFLGHFLVSGAKLGPSDYIAQHPTTVKAILNKYKADLYLLGDVHKAQKLHKSPDVIYVGSPYRINFGERNEKKGFLLLDISEKGLKYKSIPTKDRPMLQFDLKAKELKSSEFTATDDAIIKLVIKCTKEEHNNIDESAIRNRFGTVNSLKIEYEITDEDRVRNENINESKTPIETFVEYSKEKKFDKETVDLGLEIIRGLK